MTPRTIDIPEEYIDDLLIIYDTAIKEKEVGGGRYLERCFWKKAVEAVPEVAEGLWVFDTVRPLRPVFKELRGNQK